MVCFCVCLCVCVWLRMLGAGARGLEHVVRGGGGAAPPPCCLFAAKFPVGRMGAGMACRLGSIKSSSVRTQEEVVGGAAGATYLGRSCHS